MIRVGIVDDHPVTLLGLRSALELAPDVTIVAACSKPENLDPTLLDVLVLDVYLASDLPCIPVVSAMSAHTRVIMTSASDLMAEISQCVAAGANGYLHKGSAPERFAEAVRLVAAGGSIPLPAQIADCDPTLSPREHAVLAHIAGGLTHDQIARRLGISKHTVDTYIKRVRSKLNLGNKADLTRAALAAVTPARMRV